ncbi:MAG TPA: aminotransferase class V-fold PLP-dependent enzyme [Acidimicrobiales bacterium]|nr:aminotransferase class V-fold PLP-dependent enzyme [Acidimicrobiales bacterium]
MARAYLDHGSASPLRPAARDAMLPWLGAADPGRVHTEGRMARVALEEARDQVAEFFGTRGRQVVFTSGATEAINAAVFGAVARWAESSDAPPRIVLAGVEHSAVRDASQRHAQTRHLGVDASGFVDPAEVAEALSESPTTLVHCQLANHEIGTIQRVKDVADACRESAALLHVDAAAGAGSVRIEFDQLGADLLSVSAPKLGGPRGCGALLIRRGLRVPPLIVGGMQERARRGGLENVAAAVGFGSTAAELGDTLDDEAHNARQLMLRLREAALGINGVEMFGPADEDARLPGLLCMGLSGVEAEPVLIGLDRAGVAAHSGSSCSSESLEPSPVLEAIGADADHSLRFTAGWSTTEADVALACEALPDVVSRLRALATR